MKICLSFCFLFLYFFLDFSKLLSAYWPFRNITLCIYIKCSVCISVFTSLANCFCRAEEQKTELGACLGVASSFIFGNWALKCCNPPATYMKVANVFNFFLLLAAFASYANRNRRKSRGVSWGKKWGWGMTWFHVCSVESSLLTAFHMQLVFFGIFPFLLCLLVSFWVFSYFRHFCDSWSAHKTLHFNGCHLWLELFNIVF